jgi:ornithine cyclodeaminase
MLYLNTDHLDTIGTDWPQLTAIIANSVKVMSNGDFAQPIKPYLRYGNLKNRIIAMPAYVGGDTSMAGIKWIASFPDNIHHGKARAHSVTILNEQHTGQPLCTINTNRISAIRTAAVSGLMVQKYLQANAPDKKYTIGIIGFGPIGKMHLSMIASLVGEQVEHMYLYDLKKIEPGQIDSALSSKITIASSWEACYEQADIFITCTVSDKPYINKPPKKGSLQLNISLRDYTVETRQYMDLIIVDDWDEVCRQNTDIENMHRLTGLQKEDTFSVIDLVRNNVLSQVKPHQVTMFNPMGMAIFDIAVGGHYYKTALQHNVGIQMPE